jgi:hypothetical protein
LFPRAKIPADFHSDGYEAARREVCRFLLHFRSKEMALRFTPDLPHEPLMICDESAKLVALGESKDEDNEFEKVIKEDAGLRAGN